MKNSIWILLITCWILPQPEIAAQDALSLPTAYMLTEKNIPILRSIDIYAEIEKAQQKLFEHSRKPIISINGNAGLQSEAIQIGSSLPNSPINIDVPLYSARAYGELLYNLHEGGLIHTRKRIAALQRIVHQQKVAVDIYPFKEQINELFTSINLSRKLMTLYALTIDDISIRQERIAAGIEMGTILESEATQLSVRQLEIQNEIRKIEASIGSAIATLSVLTGIPLSNDIILELPDLSTVAERLTIDRPELAYFERQAEAVLGQKELIEQLDKPEVFLFARTGVAYPNALNFSKVQLAPYALAGVTFNYKIFDKKDKEYQKQKIDLESRLISIQSDQFRHNIAIKIARYDAEIEALIEELNNYGQIALLQNNLLEQMSVQLDNGVITISDYLLQSNAELKTRQNREITKARIYQKRLAKITAFGTNHLN